MANCCNRNPVICCGGRPVTCMTSGCCGGRPIPDNRCRDRNSDDPRHHHDDPPHCCGVCCPRRGPFDPFGPNDPDDLVDSANTRGNGVSGSFIDPGDRVKSKDFDNDRQRDPGSRMRSEGSDSESEHLRRVIDAGEVPPIYNGWSCPLDR